MKCKLCTCFSNIVEYRIFKTKQKNLEGGDLMRRVGNKMPKDFYVEVEKIERKHRNRNPVGIFIEYVK